MNFADLIGQPCDFYGIDNNRFRLGRGAERWTFEAIEDESDGYRSMLDKVATVEEDPGGIFFATPVAVVTPENDASQEEGDNEPFEGWVLRDASGHAWLQLGTHHGDDYYPQFTFLYTPSGEQHAQAS